MPDRASCPQPQNRATPAYSKMVAMSDGYGIPPRHLMQHSKHPKYKKKKQGNVQFWSIEIEKQRRPVCF